MNKLRNKKGEMFIAGIVLLAACVGLTVRAVSKGYYKNPVPIGERNNATQWYKADILKP